MTFLKCYLDKNRHLLDFNLLFCEKFSKVSFIVDVRGKLGSELTFEIFLLEIKFLFFLKF